jgi:acyl-CoA synthetase (AMP-forming)/AMP-acid ligase II
MQHHPLLISSLLEHAANAHPNAQIVSCAPETPVHRCTYADLDRRARKLAKALRALGVREGDRVGTMAWNGHRHMELFFGVSGMGAVLQQRLGLQARQGRVPYGVGMKLTDDEGHTLPHDGKAFDYLLVRGHWIAAGYFGGEGGRIADADKWFDTSDIATIDVDGYMQITDRAKDLIKSGGEWISSIALENAAVGHPSVAEAAVIAIAHEKWQERPLMIVVKKPGNEVTKEELLDYLADKVAKWWLPDDVVFVDELPHTATGKLQKMKLRESFGSYKFANP